MTSALASLRTLTGCEPAVIAPSGSILWPSCKRLRGCEVFAIPDGDCTMLMTPFAWLDFRQRDVCFWPLDCWSSHVMTLIVQSITQPEAPNGPMSVVRWAWGHPAADELGEPDAVIETVWRRESPVRSAVAA